MQLNQAEEDELRNEIQEARETLQQRPGGIPPGATDLQCLILNRAEPRFINMALAVDAHRNTLNAKDDTGMTALMYAAKMLYGDAAQSLVQAGADKAIQNEQGGTALDIFNEAYNADQEAIDADVVERIRDIFRGGRRRKTRRRKMSRAYCRKTACRRMGFSQKASCRPYKNCYRK